MSELPNRELCIRALCQLLKDDSPATRKLGGEVYDLMTQSSPEADAKIRQGIDAVVERLQSNEGGNSATQTE